MTPSPASPPRTRSVPDAPSTRARRFAVGLGLAVAVAAAAACGSSGPDADVTGGTTVTTEAVGTTSASSGTGDRSTSTSRPTPGSSTSTTTGPTSSPTTGPRAPTSVLTTAATSPPTAPPPTTAPPATTTPPTTSAPPSGVQNGTRDQGCEQEMFARINGARADAGQAALTYDGGIQHVPLDWSDDMAGRQVLSHNPNYGSQIGAVRAFRVAGENVGRGYSTGTIFTAFMNSEGHRRNIVYPDYTHAAVGCVLDGKGQLWVTQNFWG